MFCNEHQDLIAALRITLKISIKMTAATDNPVAISQSFKPNSAGIPKISRANGSTVIP